jgi:hypothetical protein
MEARPLLSPFSFSRRTMTKSLYGFSPRELNSEDIITAVLAHWNEPQSQKPAYTV